MFGMHMKFISLNKRKTIFHEWRTNEIYILNSQDEVNVIFMTKNRRFFL